MLIALFSQYLTKIKIPVPAYSKERGGCYVGRFPLFRLFPVSIGNSIAVNEVKQYAKHNYHYALQQKTACATSTYVIINTSYVDCGIQKKMSVVT